jgi:predicted GIY-YIG superfamily endonuclease
MSSRLKVVRRNKSPFWYMRGSIRGIRIDESTKIVDDGSTTNKRQAEEIRAKREIEIVEGGPRKAIRKPRGDIYRGSLANKFAYFLKNNIEPAGYLYRHYDPSGDLLYVGVTQGVAKRTNTHLSQATWKDFIYQIIIEPFETREELLEAERAAIRNEFPKFNQALNGRRHPIQELAHRTKPRKRKLTLRQANRLRFQRVLARRAAAAAAAVVAPADTTPDTREARR